MGSPVWALAGVGQDSAGKVARGSSLELSGRDLCPRSGPGSLLPYVQQSQVPRDWIGAGAVFHSPEVLGSMYIFLLGELSPLILRDIKEKYLLLPVVIFCLLFVLFGFVVLLLLLLLLLLELGFCSYGCLLLGLLKDYFLAFSRVWFLSLYWLFF